MLKVGDKVLCKRDLLEYDMFFIKGNYYKITKVKSRFDETWLDIYIEDDKKNVYSLDMILDNGDNSRLDEQFIDYFYTKEEERKLKLDKIDGDRRQTD